MDLNLPPTTKRKSQGETTHYSFMLSPHTHNRLERHIFILKKLVAKSTTKQDWLLNAITEKFANDENKQELPKAAIVNIKINKEIDKELIRRIEFIKKFRCSYSKKQWLVEAVLEKLDRDETAVEQRILDAKKSQELNNNTYE